MEVLTKAELSKRYDEILSKIRKGAVFIHPSDTIYGLGCLATSETAVQRIRNLKQQFHQPLSIWVPSLDWVQQHCVVEEELLLKLPGPFTLVLKMKDTTIPAMVTLGQKTIGIRLPDHWLRKLVEDLGIPIITTSANKTGKPFMTCLEDLDMDIVKGIDFMIYEGEKKARPSKIIVEGSVKER